MAIIIKTALLASLSIILLTNSTTPVVKPIDVFAEADDSVDAAPAQVYISDDNSDNNDGRGAAAADSTTVNNNEEKETGWSDIEYLRDADNNTMVDYKNLFGLNIGKVYNPNFVDNADWFLDSSNYEDHVDYYLIPYNYNWHFYSDISAPWYGCEAQSKAMLVTAKKYNETGDSKYLEFSKKVFNGLNSPVLNQDGWLLGVVAANNNGQNTEQSAVLRCEPDDLLRIYRGRASTDTIQKGCRCSQEKYQRPIGRLWNLLLFV